jgi:hypothetical protein
MTKIFSTYSEFLSREDKKINGVSQDFADEYPDFEKDNESNRGCWNCSGCSGCSGCSDCSDCSRCSRCSRCSDLEYKSDRKEEKNEAAPLYENVMGNYPVIENIHQKIYEAASAPKDLRGSECTESPRYDRLAHLRYNALPCGLGGSPGG